MGLTANSTGSGAIDTGLHIQRGSVQDRVIGLAGNPNVGKSTVFNALTGLNQHTGNWPGKTVTNAQGNYQREGRNYILVDLPGTYSLLAHSAEEEVARDFICFGDADATVVVCDATCLERNLNLVLQTIEITPNVVVCVNLLDEAEKKGIQLDLKELSNRLGVPVVGTSARKGKGLEQLTQTIETCVMNQPKPMKVVYTTPIEQAVAKLEPVVSPITQGKINARWLSLKLLEQDEILIQTASEYLQIDLQKELKLPLREVWEQLKLEHIGSEKMRDDMVSCLVTAAGLVSSGVVHSQQTVKTRRDRKIDRILTNRWTGIPLMILLLLGIFWITITGANYPSQLLSTGLFWIQDRLTDFFMWIGAPDWLHGILVLGVYRVLAWVVSVMLPPMAIFFPLFTLLEDLGYLPRVAFNLDHFFKKACTCGKQALTMCMGFGCNAAGIVGCRIIDSPRERLIAMITNSFVPCNGRFPILISIITMFFVGSQFQSFTATLLLTGMIVLGIAMTFWVSRLLSKTILKGIPSSFTLELPPYRRPQIGKVIVRSLLDRTIFVLGRAVAVAAPAGAILWIMANVTVGDATLLAHCSNFLDPFGHLLGMDGTILLAFILGWPANEIVVPIIIMAYMCSNSIMEFESLLELKTLLVDHGWTWLTAICTMLFCLMHWPCSTTCFTIKKESKSWKWTIISFLTPTLIGMACCFVVANISRIFVPGI